MAQVASASGNGGWNAPWLNKLKSISLILFPILVAGLVTLFVTGNLNFASNAQSAQLNRVTAFEESSRQFDADLVGYYEALIDGTADREDEQAFTDARLSHVTTSASLEFVFDDALKRDYDDKLLALLNLVDAGLDVEQNGQFETAFGAVYDARRSMIREARERLG